MTFFVVIYLFLFLFLFLFRSFYFNMLLCFYATHSLLSIHASFFRSSIIAPFSKVTSVSRDGEGGRGDIQKCYDPLGFETLQPKKTNPFKIFLAFRLEKYRILHSPLKVKWNYWTTKLSENQLDAGTLNETDHSLTIIAFKFGICQCWLDFIDFIFLDIMRDAYSRMFFFIRTAVKILIFLLEWQLMEEREDIFIKLDPSHWTRILYTYKLMTNS